jgi:hypothetical protein
LQTLGGQRGVSEPRRSHATGRAGPQPAARVARDRDAQIAKALGAQVTAVCSTRNLELMRSLGVDHGYRVEVYAHD